MLAGRPPYETRENALGTLVQIVNDDPPRLPDAGRLCLEDPETGEQFFVDTSHPAVRRQYASRMSERQEHLVRVLRKNGVERIDVRLDEDYAPAMKAYFRARRRRKR